MSNFLIVVGYLNDMMFLGIHYLSSGYEYFDNIIGCTKKCME
jgi:hypothetical protein